MTYERDNARGNGIEAIIIIVVYYAIGSTQIIQYYKFKRLKNKRTYTIKFIRHNGSIQYIHIGLHYTKILIK